MTRLDKQLVNYDVIRIGSQREVFWDEHLLDTRQTTAKLKLHHLQAREAVIEHNEPWEGDGCDFHCILKDNGFYRMYYLGWDMNDPGATQKYSPSPISICYAESTDGIKWVKPKLGICEFNGSRQNNIILDRTMAKFDNFSVFKDPVDDCPQDEVYKGVGLDRNDHYLWCFTSADGIRFKKAWRMTDHGKFDTLNIAFWNRHANEYVCYIRDFHDVPGNNLNAGIRDIRWMVSKDFKNWTVPVLLDFNGGQDYPLYTNLVQPYYRADHMFIGFPSRYVEKKKWTSNFDQLAGAERRQKRMKASPRLGLTVTDCVFMSSRDGKQWKRWDEAFMTPGIEREYNWVYGDCYPALGMIETPSALPFAPNELSMYAMENHWGHIPTILRRYTIRLDGFVSCHAAYEHCRVVLKPFIFAGRQLSINFATSAAGGITIKLNGAGTTLNSIEMFGDSLDRTVVFEKGNLAALAGKPVTMEINMSDADIYSFQFNSQSLSRCRISA